MTKWKQHIEGKGDIMRVSSRGNPYHDEKGRFASADSHKIKVINSDEYYRERTEERYEEQRRSKETEGTLGEVQKQPGCNQTDNGRCGNGIGNNEGYGGTGRDSGNVLSLLRTHDAKKFSNALEEGRHSHKYGCYVDGHSAEELAEMKMFLSEDGKTGIAVKPDGDIVCAFNSNKGINAGKEMLAVARENGGVKMDCYGEKLAQMYNESGFEVVNRVEFNAEYVPKDKFHAILHENKPYVYTLKANSDSAEVARKKAAAGQYKAMTKDELSAVKTYDKDGYDDAIAERDSLIKKG